MSQWRKKDIRSTTVTELFQELAVNPRGIGVHVNGIFVHWIKYNTWQIQDQDESGHALCPERAKSVTGLFSSSS